MCTETLHEAQVHDRRTMHTLEQFGVEYFFELFHRSAEDVSASIRVDAHVVPGSVNPLNRGNRNAYCLTTLAYGEDVRAPRLRRFGPVREQLLEGQFARP